MVKSRRSNGFTLIELLCVLVILAVLVVLVGRTVVCAINKSKEDIDQNQERSILNATEKWAVKNSHRFDDIEGSSFTVGLDVIFIVDVSGSMKYDMNTGKEARNYKNSRMYATTEAINSSLDVLNMNKDNKVGFVFYSGRILSGGGWYGGGSCSNSTGNGATPNCSVIKKVDLTNIDKIVKLGMTSLSKFSVNRESINVEGGTYTLIGLQQALTMFSKNSKSRIPVVILLTDGEPSWGRTMNESSPFAMGNSTIGNGSNESLRTSDNNQMVWSIMRTAYLMKQELSSNYQAEAFFYTIGLGVTSNYGEFMLNPAMGTDKLKNGDSYDKAMYSYMRQVDKSYIYPTAAFLGNMSAEELKKIFVDIATEVTKATEIKELCITVDELKTGGYLSSDAKINDKLAQNTYVIISENVATNQYVFSIAKTEEQKKTCQILLSQN